MGIDPLRAGRFGVRTPVCGRGFLVHTLVQTHKPSCALGTWLRYVKLTTQSYLVPRLKMSWVLPPIHLCPSMHVTRTCIAEQNFVHYLRNAGTFF
jgi:hypothetical protein